MAVEILKEKCIGCGQCFKSCPYDAFEFEAYDGNKLGKVAKINAKCSSCNQCLTACKFGAIKEVQQEAKVDLSAYKHIWVFAEQRQGKIRTWLWNFWEKVRDWLRTSAKTLRSAQFLSVTTSITWLRNVSNTELKRFTWFRIRCWKTSLPTDTPR